MLMLIVLMVQLQSFSRLFLVLSVAPLGLIGVVAVMLFTNTPMGFVATLGIIALAGMIIRNSVILVDQIEDNRAGGRAGWEAVIEAAQHRLRPIMLTASAAILGMIPIMRDVFWGPMAYAIVGGLAGATAADDAVPAGALRHLLPHQGAAAARSTATGAGGGSGQPRLRQASRRSGSHRRWASIIGTRRAWACWSSRRLSPPPSGSCGRSCPPRSGDHDRRLHLADHDPPSGLARAPPRAGGRRHEPAASDDLRPALRFRSQHHHRQYSSILAGWAQSLANFSAPPPPDWLAGLPLIGPKASSLWASAAISRLEGLPGRLAPMPERRLGGSWAKPAASASCSCNSC